MYAVSDAMRAALDGDNQPCARLLSLDAAGNIRASWEATDTRAMTGTVSGDRTRQVRYAGSLTVANDAIGTYSPTQVGDWFFTGERIRIERGVMLGGTPFCVPLATLVVASFDVDDTGRVTISGNSPFFLCQRPFGEVVNLAVGMRLKDAFLRLFEPVLGDGSAWSLDDGGQTLVTVPSWTEDAPRLQSALSLFSDYGLEAFEDRMGQPVLRPVADPTTQATARSYVVATGESLMIGIKRSGSSLPFNRQVVVGQGPDQVTVRGQADVDDPASPIHASRIGLLPAEYIRSPNITTQNQANRVARIALTRQAFRQDAVSVPLVPDVTTDPGDVDAFVEQVTRTNDRYWLSSVEMPVLEGTMTVAGPKAIPLFAEAA